MANRETATHQEVLDHVYAREEREWGAIKTLANRTNNALLDITGPAEPSARRLRFETGNFTVIRVIKPE
jgi:hypothetical protein